MKSLFLFGFFLVLASLAPLLNTSKQEGEVENRGDAEKQDEKERDVELLKKFLATKPGKEISLEKRLSALGMKGRDDNMATDKERRQHFKQLFNQHFERTRVARTACGDYCAEKCAPILIAFWYAWVGYVVCVGSCGISCENGGIDIGNSTRFV